MEGLQTIPSITRGGGYTWSAGEIASTDTEVRGNWSTSKLACEDHAKIIISADDAQLASSFSNVFGKPCCVFILFFVKVAHLVYA